MHRRCRGAAGRSQPGSPVRASDSADAGAHTLAASVEALDAVNRRAAQPEPPAPAVVGRGMQVAVATHPLVCIPDCVFASARVPAAGVGASGGQRCHNSIVCLSQRTRAESVAGGPVLFWPLVHPLVAVASQYGRHHVPDCAGGQRQGCVAHGGSLRGGPLRIRIRCASTVCSEALYDACDAQGGRYRGAAGTVQGSAAGDRRGAVGARPGRAPCRPPGPRRGEPACAPRVLPWAGACVMGRPECGVPAHVRPRAGHMIWL